ncbi:hypothetical protein [Geobacillus sp. WSUCF-018B]|uniref:hypothetical protein n=1 Tax=Geobacillus sp. WSUCF-018B TaxID=2055939 RepID=UPI000C28E75B|nr:hypothetical protein [Geobacillus sp. WSUCF-018B]PJW18901.1 hypothetical protein CV944_01475 [Geobacillus sp. WSUCF-018B]
METNFHRNEVMCMKNFRSKYLFDEPPLVVSPTIAKVIGLNEAIILQQIHYWLDKSQNVRDGHVWVFNSYAKWQEQFPFWSEATIKRTIKNLEKMNLLIVGNYNKRGFDKSKWYRINYEVFEQLMDKETEKKDMTDRSGQIDQMDQVNLTKWNGSSCTDDRVKLTKPIPDNTTDIYIKSNTKNDSKKTNIYDSSKMKGKTKNKNESMKSTQNKNKNDDVTSTNKRITEKSKGATKNVRSISNIRDLFKQNEQE